jgi:Holliday junction resolvasome RuvABC endonuclease subunit
MASYGICVGVLGALRAKGIPFFELTPDEVKIAATNNKKATKDDMIQWARGKYPNANWPYYKKNGEMLLSAKQAEHMADAVATIEAGVHSPLFRQFTLLRA